MNSLERHDFNCNMYYHVGMDIFESDGLTIIEITSEEGVERIFLNNDQLRVLIEMLERKRMEK